MKYTTLALFFSVSISFHSFSQGTDGVLIDPNNTTTRDASAVFQAQSTSQGMLVPRMTAAQRAAIPVSAARDGLLVYQTDAPAGFWYYNASAWVQVSTTTGGTGYIQNQFSSAQNANYWISGTGRASALHLNDGNTALTEGSGDALRIGTGSGYVDIGAMNTGYAHMQTDRPRYYMNVGLTVDQGLIGSYDENLQLQTAGTTRITALNTNGYVGIGSTTPGAQLDIQGASGLRIGNGAYDANVVFGNNATWKSGIRVFDNGVAEMRIWHTNAGGKIFLSTGYNGDQSAVLPTDGLVVSGNNVGIGAMVPFDKVNINGRLRFGTNAVSYQNAGAGATFGTGDPTSGIGWGNQSLDEYGIFVAPQETPYGDYTRLVIGWHTGVKIGASSGYGGTRFYNNSPVYGGSNATEIMSVGKGDDHVRVENNLYVGAYGGMNSSPTSYGSLALIQAKGGYYGLLMGQGSSNPNIMYDGSGNGGVYYQNTGIWQSYYLVGPRHTNINTSTDLGATLGIAGTLAVVDGTQGAGKVLVSNSSGVASWVAPGSIGAGDNLGNHIATTSLKRSDHAVGFFEGSYNNVGANDAKSNPIYTIGSSYNPTNTALSNMYGIGYSHSNFWGTANNRPSDWGLYVAAAGVTRVILDAGSGIVWSLASTRSPIFYDIDNTGYYMDPTGSSRLSTIYSGDVYNDLGGWFRNYGVTGIYNQTYSNHFYASSTAYWSIGAANGTNTGIIFRNGHQGAIQGYAYSDASGFGLLHSSGGWGLRTTPGVTEAYNTFYASTSYIPFIYDRDNTGYYMDPNSTSRMYYGDYNYLHTQTNDSWFPYTGNNWNYFRGNSYITNAHWYDENNTGYYFNLDNTNRIATLYHGTGAYSASGWLSGIMQTESANDGHQYVPVSANWGFVGTSGQYWWYIYSNNFVDVSRRETKRNITPVDNSLSEFVMNDIDKIKPSFYKYKVETDEMEAGNEAKYRSNMHLGVILDESPDYIQDQAFSGIDIYAIATMGIVGVKHNREEIKQIKEAIGFTSAKMTIQDFGNEKMSNYETWVSFSDEFIDKAGNDVSPIVTVTPNQAGVSLSVVETSAKGFKVATKEKASLISFNWIAMAKVDVKAKEDGEQLSPELVSQLKVDEAKKTPIKQYWENQKNNNQAEHSRQAEEHEHTVEFGKANYMETVNPESKKPGIAEVTPVDAYSTLREEENPTREGAPQQRDLLNVPSDPVKK